jgi:DNA-binding transcriptional MerR regulator
MKETKEKIFSIGEAARMCGVTTKQIRHWEEKGYIPEPQRVVCGERAYRQFGEEDLEIIKRIKWNLDAGFRLEIAAQKAKADIAGRKTKDEEGFNHERDTRRTPA